MKKVLMALFGLMLVFGLVLVACDNGNGTTSGNDSIVGSWNHDTNTGMTITFTATTWSIAGTQYSGSYTANNGSITINMTGQGQMTGTYSITDNKLTLGGFANESGWNGTYTKQ